MTYKIDFHVHTDASADGRSTLEQQIAAAKRAGLDAMAVTDHNRCSEAGFDGRLMLIAGCEVSTNSGHLLALFLDKPLDLDALFAAGRPDAHAAVEEIHRCGGLVFWAHPYASNRPPKEEIHTLIDGVETVNARAVLDNASANGQARLFADRHGLPYIGGSDAHAQSEIGNAFTVVECEALTPAAVKAAVLGGQALPVFKRGAPRLQKGLSQFTKAFRSKKLRVRAKGVIYLLYCAVRGVFKK